MNMLLLQRLWQALILRPVWWPLVVVAWAIVVGASYAWNYNKLQDHANEMAALRGRLVFLMVQTTRAWVALHGGVYAPVSGKTPPNVYLDVPDKVIATPDGKLLTKINPAYMTRQLGELLIERGDLRIHLTSLKPINPGNVPDTWEASALAGFAERRSALK